MFRTKIVSSQEKIFPDSKYEDFAELKRISVLKGERLSFQFLHSCDANDNFTGMKIPFEIKGSLAEFSNGRDVLYIPAPNPITNGVNMDDGGYLPLHESYPDILRPFHYGNKICCYKNISAVWVTVDVPRDFRAGTHTLTVVLTKHNGEKIETSLEIEVINQVLDADDIYVTQWLHCDSLANYYDIPVWSEKHWEIVENFARVAFKNGINILYTPLFTPPLDTAPGGERLTTQLVKIDLSKGVYKFDFTLLDRWVEMAERIGYEVLEMNHLFTQWGAEHAPKIMATVDGEYKKIFGWETDAKDEKYTSFLRQFLTELVKYLKGKKSIKRVFFHISDEPHPEHLDYYMHDKNAICDILKDHTIIDALSNVTFYKSGAVELPVPATNHIDEFLAEKLPHQWAYYCCSQWKSVSNRFNAMPACRNRCIGTQFYKYNIEGFLHWGFNFYADHYSGDTINPYIEQCGDGWISSGDGFSVYPGMKGEALESPRLLVFYEALQDLRAMKVCERYYSHEEVVKELEKIHGEPIEFNSCVKTGAEMLAMREKINEMIKAKI